MDVRAKQRLCYRVVRLTQTGVVAVSPHVISSVELNRYAMASVLTLLYAYHGDLNCRMDAAAYRVTAHVRATSRHW